MKEITQKQIIEWQAELDVQKQKKLQAEQVLDETNRTILMIEGGIQFAQIALKKSESIIQPSGTVELGTPQGKMSTKSKGSST
jgi:hypothetical protein|tara:strand:- start:279 stop:527 length:249 start_codon:yes stop_codon:yes gene_type:complete